MAKSLYEEIEKIKNDRESKFDYFTSQASQASQDALSLCNNLDNSVTHSVTSTSQGRHSEPTPKQDPCSYVDPSCQGAELISRDLQYLAGITEDLTGWILWKRIEQGKEHRVALDAAGVIRWEQWYSLERVIIPV